MKHLTALALLLLRAATASPQSPFAAWLPAPTAPVCQPASSSGGTLMPGSKVGLVRGGVFNFDSDGNTLGPQPADPLDRVDAFAPPGGIQPGDIAVVGDWSGDGHAKAGWFRPATGQWWLDLNNNGMFDAGDYSYSGFGGAGDVPVVGDWAGLGRSAIGIVHGGFLWVLDVNADGVFQQPSTTSPITGDAVFAFGSPGVGSAPVADVPVVGNWNGRVSAAGFPISQAGGVRTYVNSSNVASGGPFLWLLDAAVPGTAANVTPKAAHGLGSNTPIAFGGGAGDIPVAGDWYATGTVQFGDFRQGFLWILDGATPLAPQSSHFNGFVFPYGGLSVDKPIVGKW